MKSLKLFERDTILLVVCILVILTAAIAGYWLSYLAGYGARPAGVLESGLIFLVAVAITLVVIVMILISAIRYFLRKEIGVGLSRIVFCIIPVVIWLLSFAFLRSDPFAQGFHSKVSESVDVEELLIWADEQFYLHGKGYTTLARIYHDAEGNLITYPGEGPITLPEGSKLTRPPPDKLEELGQSYILDFYTDEEGKQIMEIAWGSGFGHWGLLIGSSTLNEYNRATDGTLIEWEPRLWVFGMSGG
ncbi:MAG: hypothetical protein WAT72_02360 [Microgenomates group bacterium]